MDIPRLSPEKRALLEAARARRGDAKLPPPAPPTPDETYAAFLQWIERLKHAAARA